MPAESLRVKVKFPELEPVFVAYNATYRLFVPGVIEGATSQVRAGSFQLNQICRAMSCTLIAVIFPVVIRKGEIEKFTLSERLCPKLTEYDGVL